ncbi:MAG: hypothetical protein EBX51_07785, partial [Acidimicrobiia bacterium]|nr:hypothetical protein [Acidimicrobiia bacterium]
MPLELPCRGRVLVGRGVVVLACWFGKRASRRTPVSTPHPNVVRVVEAARALGLNIDVRRFPDGTKTAQDAAAAIGVQVGQIVKSLVFAVDGEIVMAYVSGANQLDEKKLAAAAGGTKCSRVDADAVREATGFP